MSSCMFSAILIVRSDKSNFLQNLNSCFQRSYNLLNDEKHTHEIIGWQQRKMGNTQMYGNSE